MPLASMDAQPTCCRGELRAAGTQYQFSLGPAAVSAAAPGLLHWSRGRHAVHPALSAAWWWQRHPDHDPDLFECFILLFLHMHHMLDQRVCCIACCSAMGHGRSAARTHAEAAYPPPKKTYSCLGIIIIKGPRLALHGHGSLCECIWYIFVTNGAITMCACRKTSFGTAMSVSH